MSEWVLFGERGYENYNSWFSRVALFQNIQKMVWYFNFCSPHLNDDETVNMNRTLMVIELVIAMFITFVVHMLAELYDEESNRVKNEADPPEETKEKEKGFEESAVSIHKGADKEDDGLDIEKMSLKNGTVGNKVSKKEEPGFFRNKKIFFLTVETVENKAPCFFGHFAIVLSACIMYTPFYYQSAIGFIYIVSCCLMLVFEAWKYQRMLTLSVTSSYLCILALMTSAAIGVGLTNWDPFTINCYYTKLGM